ncbi:MAG: hypothetical protein M3Y64_03670 [Gemmatimonadota bacterium]|nr:hypothetical protein [Gemmatimonadota bacterium]
MKRVVALVIIGLLVWLASRRAIPESTGTATNRGAVVEPTAPINHSIRGFENRTRLHEHFAKHGGEFGGVSEAQYLAMAQALRDEEAGGDVLEIVRPADGVVSRFDRRSGAFLAFDRDGTIRTFFKPNDGERYFRRQANRAPSR